MQTSTQVNTAAGGAPPRGREGGVNNWDHSSPHQTTKGESVHKTEYCHRDHWHKAQPYSMTKTFTSNCYSYNVPVILWGILWDIQAIKLFPPTQLGRLGQVASRQYAYLAGVTLAINSTDQQLWDTHQQLWDTHCDNVIVQSPLLPNRETRAVLLLLLGIWGFIGPALLYDIVFKYVINRILLCMSVHMSMHMHITLLTHVIHVRMQITCNTHAMHMQCTCKPHINTCNTCVNVYTCISYI